MKAACFAIEGAAPSIFCEGYATGATLHAATGRRVVVCFSASALVEVANATGQVGDCIAADNDNAPKRGDRFGKRLDHYGTGHRSALQTQLPFYLPPTPGNDWNDAGDDAVASAFAGPPTSAIPSFDAWQLERVELRGTTWKQWAVQLRKCKNPTEAAVTAYTVASRLFLNAPALLSLAAIRAQIESELPAGTVHPTTLDRIMARLDLALRFRKEFALDATRIPAPLLARHQHTLVDGLTDSTLGPADYERGGVVILRAPMGTGKTQRVGAPLASWAKANRRGMLAVCHRQSLVKQLAVRLELPHYREIEPEEAAFTAQLATCLPSITLTEHAPIVDRAEVVFIDEIQQVLRFIESRDHCRTEDATNEGVFNRLRGIVRRARLVVAADAGADARTVEFLEACRPGERFRIVEMKQVPERIEATYHVGGSAHEGVVGDVLEELAAGGRAWLAVESKDRAAILGELFTQQGFRVMAVTADNKGDTAQAEFLADPEAESRRYEIVIASPVIGSGISIQHDDNAGKHFTLAGFVGGGHRVTPSDARQMMARVRYLKRFTLGLTPNNRLGRHSPEAILTAWQQAAQLEGKPASADDFSHFVAGIRADDMSLRNDFAAGLLWQLEAAGWNLRQATEDHAALGLSGPLKAIKDAQEADHRAELLAAPVIDYFHALRLERTSNRTRSQETTLEAHRVRRALGVSVLDDAAIDFFDNGAGLRRLDRFTALRGVAPAFDDRSDNLARRRYWRACAKVYADLFAGFDLTRDRITEGAAEIILGRMIERRFLLAHLGVAASTYGTWQETKDGRLLPFSRPKNARQELAALLDRAGLKWRAIRSRVSTPAQTDIANMAQGGYKTARNKMGRVYQVTQDSWAGMQAWADRRDAARATVRAVVIGDASYWRGVRQTLIEQEGRISRRQAEVAVVSRIHERGLSPHAWLTALWLKTELGPRLAA